MEHQQPRFVEVGQAPEQALISELVETRQHIYTKLGRRSAHRLHLLQVPAAREHRYPREKSTLRLVEQVVAPRDGAPERLLAARQVARAAGEHVEARLQTAEQRLRAEELDPRRGELDRERKAIDPLTDPGDRRRVFVGDREVVFGRDRALDEELDPFVLGQCRE